MIKVMHVSDGMHQFFPLLNGEECAVLMVGAFFHLILGKKSASLFPPSDRLECGLMCL